MKTSLHRLLALAIVALMAIPVSAQRGSVGLGVYAGYNGSSMEFDNNANFASGGEVGLMVPIQITNKFRLTPSVSYVFEGPAGKFDPNSIPTSSSDFQTKLTNLSIGFINLEANILFNVKRLRPYLSLGASCGFYKADFDFWSATKFQNAYGSEEYYYEKSKRNDDDMAYRAYIGVGTDFRLNRKSILQVALKLGIQSPSQLYQYYMDDQSYEPNFFVGVNVGYFFNFK